MANEREREKKKITDYRQKLGWETFTTAFLKKHSVQIKQVPVCEECNNRFRGTFPSFCLFFFFTFHAFCHLVCAQLVVRFRTVISSSFICNHFPLLFSFSLHVSQLLSLVMSLSRRESLGYQCSASDRKRMINKLSCFSSPLYIPPFFSETRTPAAPNDISPHSTPPPHHPSFPSLLPCRGWQGVTGV